MDSNRKYNGMLRGINAANRIIPVLYFSIVLKVLFFIGICSSLALNKSSLHDSGGFIYFLFYFAPLAIFSLIVFCISLLGIFLSRKVKTESRTKLIKTFFIDLVMTAICFSLLFLP